jgi:hypothetical protein
MEGAHAEGMCAESMCVEGARAEGVHVEGAHAEGMCAEGAVVLSVGIVFCALGAVVGGGALSGRTNCPAA